MDVIKDQLKVLANINKLFPKTLIPLLILVTLSSLAASGYLTVASLQNTAKTSQLLTTQSELENNYASTSAQLATLQMDDQYQRNEKLQKQLNAINSTYSQTVSAYEKLTNLREGGIKTQKLDGEFANILSLLAKRELDTANSSLESLNQQMDIQLPKTPSIATNPSINVATDNKPPDSGYKRQNVQTDSGTFLVDIISANLDSTKVIVDTASESDCANNCPVLSLGDYANRSGAFAGINGSFFCPESYPSCAGKTNSFDTLIMNKNKQYFNSDNNVYSIVPAVIFSAGSVRFVGQSLQWGRDTGIDSMIANYPLLLSGGNSQFSGSGDQKITAKGARCFIGTNGKTVYIGVVHNASTEDEVQVLKTLAIQDALGLDQGGSTALWYGGYKVGPGRSIPNAILFVKK